MTDDQINYSKILNFLNSNDRFIGRKELSECFPEIESSLEQLSLNSSEIMVLSIFNKAPEKRNDWDYGLVEELYCSKKFYFQLLFDLSEEYISGEKEQIHFGYLAMFVKSNLATYLGLDRYWIDGFSKDDLWDVINEHSDKFLLKSISKFDERDNYFVSIRNEKQVQNNNLLLLLQIQKLVHSNREISISRLLVKLNLDSADIDIPKPLSMEYLRKFIESSDQLTINKDIITVKSLSSRINYAITNKNAVSDFDKSLNFPGLLVFSFSGKTFPIKEAIEYINLRQIVFISIAKNLASDVIEFSNSESSELIKNLEGFLDNINVYQWIEENLAVSFVIEDYDYLKLNFDKLMQEYSPVLNLDKNPGNLFRTIIEEKIREYESGKES